MPSEPPTSQGPISFPDRRRIARRVLPFLILWVLCLGGASGASAQAATEGVRLEAVAEGVWAVLQPPPRRFRDSNSAVIRLGDGLLVVDSQVSPASTEQTLEAIRKVVDLPVRYLVNTHWHGDHTQGNQVYVQTFPDLEILGQQSLLEEVPERATAMREEEIGQYETAIAAAEETLRTGKDAQGQDLPEEQLSTLPGRLERGRQHLAGLRKIEAVVPSMAFDRRLELQRGERTVVLLSFKAHTRGDTVIYLPKERVLITGDLLDELPWAGHGYLEEWSVALTELAALDATQIIPGHGPVLKREHLQQVRELLRSAQDQAAAAIKEHGPGEQAQAAVSLESFREQLVSDPVSGRAFDQFIPDLIKRALAEAAESQGFDPEGASADS